MRRRDFILAGPSIGVAALAGRTAVGREDPISNPTADDALQRLVDGNERFVNNKSKHPHMTNQWLKRLTQGQKPFATILACSDSRVPLELLFDQGFGDLFVIRVAGNIVTRYGVGSLEYAQHHLQTPLFMVLGHEGCGAVTAALLPPERRQEEPQGVRELLDLVHVGEVDPNADTTSRVAAAVEANVRHATRKLRQLDPEVEGFQVRPGNMLVAAVYEISSGRVRILERITN